MKCVGKKLSVELREECIVLVWALIVALSHLLCKKHYPSYLAANHHFLLTHRKKKSSHSELYQRDYCRSA